MTPFPPFRRGQIALEFIIMLGMAIILMLAFLAVINIILEQRNAEAKDEIFNELGTYVQQELILAETREPGYSRTFDVPPSSQNESYSAHPYTMTMENGTLTIVSGESTYNFAVPNATGHLFIGENTIHYENGTLTLNP